MNIVVSAVQVVIVAIANVFLLGGLSKLGKTPLGGARAGWLLIISKSSAVDASDDFIMRIIRVWETGKNEDKRTDLLHWVAGLLSAKEVTIYCTFCSWNLQSS